MEQELAEHRASKAKYDQVNSQILPQLLASSLLKTDAQGDITQVMSWEEHQQLALEKQQEEARAQQLQQHNQQLEQHVPHQERRRAMNQLEAIEDFITNKDTGLSQSVVLVDHGEVDKGGMNVDENAQINNQQSVFQDQQHQQM